MKPKLTTIQQIKNIMEHPFVFLQGSEILQIDNHEGLLQYSEKQIQVATREEIIMVEGDKLQIVDYTYESIQIKGSIQHLYYLT